jgi:lysophospholipase L1-like esterase
MNLLPGCLPAAPALFLVTLLGVAPSLLAAETPTIREEFDKARRIVFLGDSITASGQYVAYVEAWLAARTKGMAPQLLIDAGLPSETVSGLSEDGHAGGKFPRPDLAERLDRVLKVTKPDLVIACYGMNCGIYEPFDEGRFAKYQEGMKSLKAKVEAAGARFIVMTPPFYDDMRAPKKFSYNEVLDRYAAWLIDQRKQGWQVIDLHVPMAAEIRKRREEDAKFTFQPDGVHPNEAGHWAVAQQVLKALGDEKAAGATSPKEMLTGLDAPEGLLPLVQQRVNTLRDAHVATAGHKRPGVAPGLPLPEALKKADELSGSIADLWKAK